jgi:hypothetical protein
VNGPPAIGAPSQSGPVVGPIADDDEARMLERMMLIMELRRRLQVSLPRRR